MRSALLLAPCILPLLLAGCSGGPKSARLSDMYDRAAQAGELDRNPVIVIPGILGSKLAEAGDGRIVWGAFSGDYANPERPDGARLAALPMREGASLFDLRDDVVPTGVLDDVRLNLLFLPLELSAYRNILMSLGVGGYRDEELGLSGAVDYGDDHFTCFQFPYDWRRDNVENARRLHDFIVEKEAYVRDELRARSGTDPGKIKFDIVAHSMGGLLARYYLRYGDADLPEDGEIPPPTWAGAEYVERLIMIGTPNAGSASALLNLVDGVKIGPFLPTYDAAVLGTMPAVYQLLPRERHGPLLDAADGTPVAGLFDPARWQGMGWGLAGPDADAMLAVLLPDVETAESRRRIARDHLAKCLRRAERLHAALDRPAPPPPGLGLHLFAGDAKPTPAVLAVDAGNGRLRVREETGGDGTVPRSSALMDERLGGAWTPRLRTPIGWSGVTFLFNDHLGLTKDPIFTDNVLYLMLEAPIGPEAPPSDRSR